MVVFQFTATVILIIGALTTHRQFQFIMNNHLGYDKHQVINILGLETMDKNKKSVFKEELLKLSVVKSASLADFLPVYGSLIQNRTFWVVDRRHLDNGFEAARWIVDEDYLSTMGMEISLGRNFNTGSSDKQSIIINERMAKELRLEQAVGTQIIDMFDLKYDIIGVVKNFYFESLLWDVRPLAMVRGKGISTLSVKINTTDTEAAMASIMTVWNSFGSHQAIRYSFLDQRFEKMYAGLQRSKTIFLLFAILSIIVACLGLFALSIYMVEQRGKEISVRKVLGADLGRIFKLLTFDFVKLVLIAIVLATPIGWYIMDHFLSDIANRIDLSWHIFAIAGIISVVIAIGTISFETIKAAMVNPARKLRSE
jgi:putative ABC transport system permease protein